MVPPSTSWPIGNVDCCAVNKYTYLMLLFITTIQLEKSRYWEGIQIFCDDNENGGGDDDDIK
jgi:hypothetical protein